MAQSERECGIASTKETRTGGATGAAEGTASTADATGIGKDKEGAVAATPMRRRRARPGAKTTGDAATISASRGAGPM